MPNHERLLGNLFPLWELRNRIIISLQRCIFYVTVLSHALARYDRDAGETQRESTSCQPQRVRLDEQQEKFKHILFCSCKTGACPFTSSVQGKYAKFVYVMFVVVAVFFLTFRYK